jgi:hypothetical protein
MKKNTKIIFLVSLLIVFLLSSSLVYAGGDVTVYVNGKQVVSEVPAAIVADRTMLPFRAIFNALGVNDEAIKWNPDSKSIEVNSGGKYIFLMVGSNGAVVNDNMITLDAAPYISNDRTMVPVRFISEALEAKVEWNAKTRVVTITK